MNKLSPYSACLFFILIMLSILSCAGGPQGKLPRIESPTASELKQDWKDYTVYYRRNMPGQVQKMGRLDAINDSIYLF